MKTNKQDSLPFNEELTYEKLKTYKGFENITEEEAEKEIQIIRKLARIIFSIYANDNRLNSEETE